MTIKMSNHVPVLLKNDVLLNLYSEYGNRVKLYRDTRIHSSFRSVRFTKKGKDKGSPPEWVDFFLFMEQVQNGYSGDKYLQRIDQSLPYSPSNFMWSYPEDVYSQLKLATVTYKGKTVTLKEISSEYEISMNTLKSRRSKGWKDSEIVEGRPRLSKRVIHSAQDLEYQKVRNKASKMVSSYKFSDKSKGLNVENNYVDVEYIINSIFYKNCNYCGTLERIGCDRIDNSLSPSKDNLVPACYSCNVIRGDRFSVKEMGIIGEFLRLSVYDKRLE